jgi:hypothetical protein
MGDGYWSEGTLFLCTDSFTEYEVILLINALKAKFNLVANSNRRVRDSKKVC